MRQLLVFRADQQPFDAGRLADALRQLEGTREVDTENLVASVLDFEFEKGAEAVLGRLSEDFTTVTLSRVSDAGAFLALEIQRELGHPLRVIDSAYSFDVSLSGIQDIDEFWEASEASP